MTPALAGEPGEASEGETPDIVVHGDRGYASHDQLTGTRVQRPVHDVPQAVTVLPRKLLDDTRARRTDEVMMLSPSVQVGAGFGSLWDDYFVRGSRVWSGTIYRNGFLSGYSGSSALDSVNVERVEVLRGPAAALYGPGVPGGSINVVTKRPELEPHTEVAAGLGSFDTRRLTLDTTGPLSGRVAYRVTAALDDTDGVRDYNDSSRVVVDPVFSYQLGPDTVWLVESRLFRVRYRPDPGGVPVVLGDPQWLPPTRSFIEPDTPMTSFDGALLRSELSHRLSPDATLRVGVQRQQALEDEWAVYPLGLEPDGRTLDRIPTHLRLRAHDVAAQLGVTWAPRTGPIAHDVVAGVDARYEWVDWQLGAADPSVDPFPIDVAEPVYGRPAPPVLEPAGPDNSWHYADAGLYLGDTLSPVDALEIIVGGRIDAYRQTSRAPGVDEAEGELAPSGRLGVVYDVLAPWSVYGSVATGFWPVLGVSADARLLRPERSVGYELGSRLALPRDRLTVDLAVFEVRNRNLSVPDPAQPEFQVQRGAAVSRGVELSTTFQPIPLLRGIASYTLADAEVTEDPDPSLVGRRLPYVATHAGALWTFADVPLGAAVGLEVGAGAIGTAERVLNDGTEIPGYIRWDALAGLRHRGTRLSLKTENLGNMRYVRSGNDATSLQLGAPRNYLAMLSTEL